MKIFTLIFPVLVLAGSPAWAQKCPASGILEELVKPAQTEDGFVRVSEVAFQLSAETGVYEAEFEVMTRSAYNAVPSNMSYEFYKWHGPELSRTDVHISADIDAFDVVHTVDGNSFMRVLEKPINDRRFYKAKITKPKWRETIEKVEKRPEPETLADGRLKVMMSPRHHEVYVPRHELSEVWARYIKKRTPAIYKQVKCEPVE